MTSDQFFEHITAQFDQQLPFVIFSKPNASIVKGVLQKDDALHYSVDFSESGFVFAPFDTEQKAILFPINEASQITLESPIFDDVGTPAYQKQHTNSQKHIHVNLVQKGIDAIKRDEFKKVVLSRSEVVETPSTNPIILFKRLLLTYPTAFVYCWYHPKVGLWLGATPETLLSLRGNELHTMALAGTQTFNGVTDVIWKEKEKEEQQIVTDFIVESLCASVGRPEAFVGNVHSNDSTIQVSEQHTVRAGNVMHLKTDITLRLAPDSKALKLILNALHPTPAVCGFPKNEAKKFIFANESYSREFYAGFLGELNLKETITRNTNRRNVENNAYGVSTSVSNLYVNLRCMQIKDNKVHLYVGGGITKDSIAELEWEETVQKSQIIKRVL